MAKVTMPQLGESVAEGTIGKWLKQPGDHVAKYEPLLEVITDKVNAEVPSPFEGTLTEILVEEGATVPNNAEIAVIETADGAGARRGCRSRGRTGRDEAGRGPRRLPRPRLPRRLPSAPAATPAAPAAARRRRAQPAPARGPAAPDERPVACRSDTRPPARVRPRQPPSRRRRRTPG